MDFSRAFDSQAFQSSVTPATGAKTLSLLATAAQAETNQAQAQQGDAGWLRNRRAVEGHVQRAVDDLAAGRVEVVQLAGLERQLVERRWRNEEAAAGARQAERGRRTERAAEDAGGALAVGRVQEAIARQRNACAQYLVFAIARRGKPGAAV